MPRYARNGDVSLAYDVFGEGERDILVTFGWVGSFQSAWELPGARALAGAAGRRSGRVIMWDKRGTGLSERLPPDRLPTLEERMDDMRVVLDAAGSERAVAFGISEGGSLSALFAASHPERASGLIVLRRIRAHARTTRTTTGPRRARRPTTSTRSVGATWGDNAWLLKLWAPSVADDPRRPGAVEPDDGVRRHARRPRWPGWRWSRRPTSAHVLPAIRVPDARAAPRRTTGSCPVQHGRYLAEHIPGARYVELPGSRPPLVARRRSTSSTRSSRS